MRRNPQLGLHTAALAGAVALVVAAGASARAAGTVVLGISTDGVVVGSPGNLRCAGHCAIPVQRGTLVTLHALRRRHFLFSRWSGDCVGSSRTCALVLDHRQSVAAVYEGRPEVVEVTVSGPGLVTSEPNGLACGRGHDACNADFPWGTSVRLAARSGSGRLASWGAACWNVGRGACKLTVRSDTGVTAAFAHATAGSEPQTLTVQATGARVRSKPQGIACPGTCQATFPSGTRVVLTQDSGGGWSGDCVGDFAGRCPLVLDAPATVGVRPIPHAEHGTTSGYGVSVTVSGKGTVTAPGIRCGGATGTLFDCENYFTPREAVVLTARPGKSSRFARWSQFCSGTKPRCTLLVVAPMTVGAVFQR